MNLLNQYKYAIVIFMTTIIFNCAIICLQYWYFKIYLSPSLPNTLTPLLIFISSLIFTILIINKLLQIFNILESKKNVIRISTVFCALCFIGVLNLFLDGYNYKSRKINNVDELLNIQTNSVTIDHFKITNQPLFLSKRVKKGNKNKTSYYQLFYIYPFKSKSENFYYALQFEEKIDRFLFDNNELQYEQFLKKITDSLKNYDFQYTHHFEIINSSESYSNFHETLGNRSEAAAFLMPVKKLHKVDQQESIIQLIVGFGVILLCFTLIFFLSNIKKL